jgi:hemoglobin
MPAIRPLNVARGSVHTILGAAAVALSFAALPFACGSAPPRPVIAEVTLDGGPTDVAAEPPAPPLYTRLGGKDGVAAIIDSFIDNMLADKRLKKAFAHTTKGPKLDHFKQMLNDQICEIAAGGCHYTGKTMSDEHASMKITSAQFDAFVSDFQLALEEKQVVKDDQQALLDQLNLLKDQIATAK